MARIVNPLKVHNLRPRLRNMRRRLDKAWDDDVRENLDRRLLTEVFNLEQQCCRTNEYPLPPMVQ